VISIGYAASSKLVQILTAAAGLNTSITALAETENVVLSPIADQQFFASNVSSELAEKAGEAKYTAVYIYCESMANVLKEKFRSFSGSVQLTIEVRVSQDRLDGIDQQAQLYTEAVTQVLNQNRGDWGQGLFYGGRYEVHFGPVKHGGRNFIKSGKITFPVDASID